MRTGKLVGWFALVGSLAALNYASRFAEGKPPRDTLYRYGTAASGFIFYAITLGLLLWIARGLPRAELGLRAPRSWPRALGLVAAVMIAILIVETALESVLHGTREQGLEPTHWEPSRAVPFALNAAVVVLAAPLVEELTFRGVGFALLEPLGVAASIVGTSLAFAAAHGLVSGFPELFVFAVGVAIVRLRSRSIYPGMVLHGSFNAIALAAAFAR